MDSPDDVTPPWIATAEVGVYETLPLDEMVRRHCGGWKTVHTGLCPECAMFRRLWKAIRSYEMKVEDLAAETQRSAALTDRLHTVEREREEAIEGLASVTVQLDEANETCMQHQSTSDYEMGQHHAELAVEAKLSSLRDRVAELEREGGEIEAYWQERAVAAMARVEALEAAIHSIVDECGIEAFDNCPYCEAEIDDEGECAHDPICPWFIAVAALDPTTGETADG